MEPNPRYGICGILVKVAFKPTYCLLYVWCRRVYISRVLTTPFKAAGIRIDPPASDPIATGTNPDT